MHRSVSVRVPVCAVNKPTGVGSIYDNLFFLSALPRAQYNTNMVSSIPEKTLSTHLILVASILWILHIPTHGLWGSELSVSLIIIINPTAFLNKACPALPLIGFPQYSMRSVTRVQLQADEGFPSPPSVLNVSVHLKVLKVKEVTVCTQAPNWVVCASPRAQTTFSNRGQQSFVYLWLWHNPYHHNQQKLPIRGWIHLVKGQSES